MRATCLPKDLGGKGRKGEEVARLSIGVFYKGALQLCKAAGAATFPRIHN